MRQGEFFHHDDTHQAEARPIVTRVDVIDLGPGNIGSFGPPATLPEDRCIALAEEACHEKYAKPATNRYICVDGRLSEDERVMAESGQSPEEADPQLAAGIAGSETAASYMRAPETHRPLSVVLAEKTREAREDGIIVTVHGDENGVGGCRALQQMREGLHFIAENADVLVPKVSAVMGLLRIDHLVSEEDIVQSIISGKHAADNDVLWDTTPEQNVEIMVESGAEYIELKGNHCEQTERLDMTDGAFAKSDFVGDHSSKEATVQAFSASFGKYMKDTFERARAHGRTEREAALKVMDVVIFNAGKSKMLMTENAKVGVVSPAE